MIDTSTCLKQRLAPRKHCIRFSYDDNDELTQGLRAAVPLSLQQRGTIVQRVWAGAIWKTGWISLDGQETLTGLEFPPLSLSPTFSQ